MNRKVAREIAERLEPRLLLAANSFTAGDLVVYRVGTGAALTSSATAVFLDEFSPAGTLVQSIPLAASGAVELTAGGTANSEGQLTLSPDGTTIALTGYDVAPGASTQGTDNGTVALVGSAATPSYFVFPSGSVVNGNNIRSAVVAGNKLYITGASAFVQYAAVSSLTAGGSLNAATTPITSTIKNGEQLQILNGQLYFSTQKQSGYAIGGDSIGSFGGGDPTASAVAAGVADTSTASYSFFLEHLGTGTGAADTLYVADSSAGIEKYSLVGGSWVSRGTVAVTGGAFGITGSVDTSGNVHIAATNAAGLYTVTDTSGQAGTLSGTATRIVSAATGTAFDGVVFAPTAAVVATAGPTINPLGTLNLAENAGPQTVGLTGIAHNGGTGAISVSVSSDNTALVPNTGISAATISYTSPGTTGTIAFTPITAASGQAHLTVTVADNLGSTTAVETVNVISPPVITLPSATSVVVNNAITFAAAGNDAVSITDPAAGTGAIQASLSVGHGSLVLSTISGLAVTNGTNGQASFTITGTVSAIAAGLNGLTYTPTPGYLGSDSLQITASDLGNNALAIVQTSSAATALTVVAAPPALLNEIEANEPGTADNRFQYVELAGTPGAVLNNVYFVTFDGAAGSTGNADLVVNLTGVALGSDGLLVIQSSATTGHTNIPAQTTLVSDPAFFTQTGGFLNGTLSFFLYDSPNAPFVAGTDYDTNDDGVLDHLPPGSAALDHVAIPDTNDANDLIYGNVDVVENTQLNLGTADAVTRFTENTAVASSAWYGGELDDIGNVDSTIDYDSTRESTNEPTGAYLTPGAVNVPPPLQLTGPAFYLRLDPDGQHLDVWTSTTATGTTNRQAVLSAYQYIAVQGTSGADTIVVDFSDGDPLPAGGLTDTGGGNGTGDKLLVIGSTGNDAVVSAAGQISVGSAAIGTTNVGRTTFQPGAGTDTLTATSGVLQLAPPAANGGITAMTFSSVNIGTGATVSMAAPVTPAARSVLVVSTLVIAQSGGNSGGTLDLSGNDLVARGASVAAVRGEVQSGYNLAAGGNWSGAGIVSSAAAADTSHLTTLGVIQNSSDGTPTGPVFFSAGNSLGGFDGVATDDTDVLVKFTYFGDTNLNGTVDGSDYSRIDGNYTAGAALTGWFNGDFNDDGIVDGSDYALIDNAFNNQKTEPVVAPTAVPAAVVAMALTPQRSRSNSIQSAVYKFVPSTPPGSESEWQLQRRKRFARRPISDVGVNILNH